MADANAGPASSSGSPDNARGRPIRAVLLKTRAASSATPNSSLAPPVTTRRCLGAGALYREYRPFISRRDFRELIREVRRERRREALAAMPRITWNHPGTGWSMDDIHVGYTATGERLWSTTVQDLASGYKLPVPLLGTPAHGEAIAAHLARLFATYGAPLVLKEDNGSNLNHAAVLAVCDAYGVIPLPSPVWYPKYNGAIEHSQGEIRRALAALLQGRDLPPDHPGVYITSADHNLNHKPRRALHGKTSCQVFTDPARRLIVNRRTRKDIHDTIRQLMDQLLVTIVQPTAWQRANAYRYAVESVLQERGFFSVSNVRKVSTDSAPPTLAEMSL